MRLFGIIFWALLFADSCAQNTINIPLKDRLKQKGTATNLTKYLNAKKWNELFPNRYGRDKNSLRSGDFYSFKNFVTAANLFPDFLAVSDTNTKKRELAAFLANMAHETSGGKEMEPDGLYKWGLYFVQEVDTSQWENYTDTTNKNYPPVNGKHYYGRGPVQLSWNYNYGQFSEVWYGNKDTLLQHPEYLTSDPVLSFASAFWFWMTPQFPKPSCNDIMAGKWTPTANDTISHRLPGFGATVNVINGGVECGNGTDNPKTENRYRNYEYFCKYLNVLPGENEKCTAQKPFGR